jgi:hypothetical protein
MATAGGARATRCRWRDARWGRGSSHARLFADPTALGPPTGDPIQLEGYLTGVEPHGAVTRYAPALDLARDLIEQSTRPRSTVVLITDFQRSGWDGRADVRLPPGTVFEPVSLGDDDPENIAVAGDAAAVRRAAAG